jgi:putative spermidine/putrescine transport system permease protein
MIRGTYIAFAGVFILMPLIVVGVVAFTSASFVSFPPPGFSLRWMAKVLADPAFMRPLANSLMLGLAAALSAAILTVPAALALARGRFKGAIEIESFLLSPLSLPALILSIALLFYLGRLGLGAGSFGLLIGHTVIVLPYMLRTVLSVARGADPALEEAAHVLGADRWRTFLHVTLPILRPGIVAGALFAFLVSFDEVAVALLMSTVSTMTLPVAILNYVANNYDPAIAAISLIKIVLVVTLLVALELGFGLDRLMLSRPRQ